MGLLTVVASRYAPSPNNLYQTEPWATDRLTELFPVAGLRVWEPAAGNHYMADRLAFAGAKVFTSDIETYTRPHDALIDFFDTGDLFGRIDADAIITNPPYGPRNRLAVEFCRLALQRCGGYVAMLLTAKFDFGNTRFDLFKDNPRFAAKIALCDRIRWFGNRDDPDDKSEDGTEDHAWFVWDRRGSNHLQSKNYYVRR